MPYPTCSHLKEDGAPCGSPALRGKKLCFYHHRDHHRQQYLERILRATPLPKTPLDVQFRLYEVMTVLARGSLHSRRAGKLLFALQRVSTDLRNSAS